MKVNLGLSDESWSETNGAYMWEAGVEENKDSGDRAGEFDDDYYGEDESSNIEDDVTWSTVMRETKQCRFLTQGQVPKITRHLVPKINVAGQF